MKTGTRIDKALGIKGVRGGEQPAYPSVVTTGEVEGDVARRCGRRNVVSRPLLGAQKNVQTEGQGGRKIKNREIHVTSF